MSHCFADGSQLEVDVTGLIVPRFPKRLPDPLGDSHSLPLGRSLNLSIFVVCKQHLHPFGHRSLVYLTHYV